MRTYRFGVVRGTVSLDAPIKGVRELSRRERKNLRPISQDELAEYRDICSRIESLQLDKDRRRASLLSRLASGIVADPGDFVVTATQRSRFDLNWAGVLRVLGQEASEKLREATEPTVMTTLVVEKVRKTRTPSRSSTRTRRSAHRVAVRAPDCPAVE